MTPGRHDIRHNDTLHCDTKQNGLKCDTMYIIYITVMLCAVILRVIVHCVVIVIVIMHSLVMFRVIMQSLVMLSHA